MYEFSATATYPDGSLAYAEIRRYGTLPQQPVLDAFSAGPGMMRAAKAQFAGEDDGDITVTFAVTGSPNIVVDHCSYAAVQQFQEGAHDEAGKVIKGPGRAHRKMMHDQKHGKAKAHGKP